MLIPVYQVCKKWREILQKPDARQLIWDEVVVDFSHELITAVHTPIAWSDKRPSNEEFQQSFKEIRLDTCKILDFIKVRMSSLRKVVLMSSEGYYSEVIHCWIPDTAHTCKSKTQAGSCLCVIDWRFLHS